MQVALSKGKTARFGLLILSLFICMYLSSVAVAHAASATPRLSPTSGQPISWPLFGFDPRHSRFNPHENILSPSNVSSLTQAWSFPMKNYVTSSPAVVNGVVYVGSVTNDLFALNASTGAQLWSFHTGGAVSAPAVVDGVIYFGSVDGKVYALKASTGTELWSFDTKSIVNSSPTVVNGVVYVGSSDGHFFALAASSGHKLWSFNTKSIVESSPAVVNGVVYVGAGKYLYGNIFAFHLP